MDTAIQWCRQQDKVLGSLKWLTFVLCSVTVVYQVSQSYGHYRQHTVGTKAELAMTSEVAASRPLDFAVCRHPGYILDYRLDCDDNGSGIATTTLEGCYGIGSVGMLRRLVGYLAVEGADGDGGEAFKSLHERQLLSPWSLVHAVSVMGRTRHVNLDWPDFMARPLDNVTDPVWSELYDPLHGRCLVFSLDRRQKRGDTDDAGDSSNDDEGEDPIAEAGVSSLEIILDYVNGLERGPRKRQEEHRVVTRVDAPCATVENSSEPCIHGVVWQDVSTTAHQSPLDHQADKTADGEDVPMPPLLRSPLDHQVAKTMDGVEGDDDVYNDGLLNRQVVTDYRARTLEQEGLGWQISVFAFPRGSFLTSNAATIITSQWGHEYLTLEQEVLNRTKTREVYNCDPSPGYSEDTCLYRCLVEKFVGEFDCVHARLAPLLTMLEDEDEDDEWETRNDINKTSKFCGFADLFNKTRDYVDAMREARRRFGIGDKRRDVVADEEEAGLVRIRDLIARFQIDDDSHASGGGSDQDNRCGCRFPCARIDLRLQVWRSEGQKNLKYEQPFVYFHFRPRAKVYDHHYLYTWDDLVADTGGYLGLFLGLSIFSLVEMAEDTLRRQKRRSRSSRTEKPLASGDPAAAEQPLMVPGSRTHETIAFTSSSP